MIILRIKKAEFELIKSGAKKTEWRAPSLYNKRLLLKKNEEGKFDQNTEIKEICFINGYKNGAPAITVEILKICPVKFVQNFSENGFEALAGECSIEISLGKIIIIN